MSNLKWTFRRKKKNERVRNGCRGGPYFWNCRVLQGGARAMTKQEALEELKSRLRCADWVDEDYVDRVSKKALKIAIEALEREVSMYRGFETMAESMERSGETQEIRALLRDEEVKQMIKTNLGLLELIDQHLIYDKEESTDVHMEFDNGFQKETMLRLLKYAGYDCDVFDDDDCFVAMRVGRK